LLDGFKKLANMPGPVRGLVAGGNRSWKSTRKSLRLALCALV
jgi:hypothetical protein